MKISNAFLFDRAGQQMSQLQAQLVKSQGQMASGKQVVRPSDDPNRVATIDRLNTLLARQESYMTNMNLVKARFDIEEGTVGSAINLMYRAKELTVQASNDTLTTVDRGAIATELRGLRNQLLSLANAQDTNGNYLFAGSRVTEPPFAQPGGNVQVSPAYQGDQTRMEVTIGDQRSLPLNRAGSEVFVRVVRTDSNGQGQGVEFFQAFDDLIHGVENGRGSDIQRGNGEIDRMLEGLNLAQADIGTDQAILEHQKSGTEDRLITLRTNLSDVQDLDYAKAIADMNKQMLSLEAAQSSFAKISQLNLFQFLR